MSGVFTKIPTPVIDATREGASSLKNSNLLIHLIVAAFASFAISSGVWIFLDIFNATGFWVASISAAFFGAMIGWASGKNLIATLAATLLARGAILFFAVNG